MTTNQEQTSTAGHSTQNCVQSNQPIKKTIGTNQPAQNCVSQNTIAQNRAIVQSLPAGKSTGQSTPPENRASQTHVIWVASPLGRKKYFRFKDCKAWNQYKQTGVTQYIKGNIDPYYTGCAVLNIPDDPHPWNAMRSVIDQFYQRERVIAWERYEARKAIEKATKLEDRNKQLDDARWILDSRIGELKEELAQARDKITELESNQPAETPTRLDILDELLQQSDAGEWVDIMGNILDCVIGLSCYEGNTVSGSDLYFARRLQQFFIELDKATIMIADNCSISPEDIDPTSKNI